MASEVRRVVQQCETAIDSENLNLSECQLMQLPEAVFHLMRNTNLKTCDLSFNVITKLPPKLGSKFSCLTELNISHNRLSKLPEELWRMHQLKYLDVSYNSFLSVPSIAYTLPKLESFNAEKNFIADVDAERLKLSSTLKMVNFKKNPLSLRTLEHLSPITSLTVLVTPQESDDDDDDWNGSTDVKSNRNS